MPLNPAKQRQLKDGYNRLYEQRDELLAHLRKAAWVTTFSGGQRADRCSWCHSVRGGSHEEGCTLEKLLIKYGSF
jgi:hypothetical protein